MKIRVDIDVEPEEMRRLLGLPDVAGMQEDVIKAVREKISQGADVWETLSAMNKQLLPEALQSASSIQSMLMKGFGTLRGKDDEDELEADAGDKPKKRTARKTVSKNAASAPPKKK